MANMKSTKCGNCLEENNDVDATVFCKDCDLGLCADCELVHKKWFKKKGGHSTAPVNIREEVTTSSPLVSSTNRVTTASECGEEASVSTPTADEEQPPAKMHAVHCKQHTDEIIKYFCRTCSAVLCSECILFNHKEHKYARLQEAMQDERIDLQKVLSYVEQTVEPINNAVGTLALEIEQLNEKQIQFTKEVNVHFEAIKDAVETRHQEVLSRINTTTISKNTHLQAQKERLDKLVYTMKFALDAGKQASEVSSALEFFEAQGSIKKVLSSLEDELKSAQLHPVTTASIPLQIVPSEFRELIDNLQNLCTLPCQPSLCKLASPTDFTLSAPPMEIHKDVNCQLSIQAKDVNGNDLKVAGIDVKAQFINPEGGAEDCVVIDCLQGKYIISFQSKMEGKHTLHTTIGGQHINDSPMTVHVVDFKAAVLSISTDERPMFLEVGRQNMIYVTFDDGSVKIFDSNGENVGSISNLKLGLKIARGIAIDKENGFIYVAGSGNNSVVKTTLEGEVVASIQSRNMEQTLALPMGVCLADNGRTLLVGDCYSNSIQFYDSSKLHIRKTITCPHGTWGLAVDNQGNIHVGAPGRVAVISSLVNMPVFEYGKSFISIAGDVAITKNDISVISNHDLKGQILLMDWRNDTVLTCAQGYSHPLGVYVDSAGYVYAAETTRKKILRGKLCSNT